MFWNKKEKLMTWEELQEELNKPENIFDKMTTPFYILEDFIDSLWHKLRWRHIKNLFRLIKIWWHCWNVDYEDMLLYMKYSTDNLIETYEKSNGCYEGQDIHYEELLNFRESIKDVIKDESQNNVDNMCEQLKNIRNFWI